MGGEWHLKRIGELGRVVTGKTPPTKNADYFGGQYPFITIPDLSKSRDIHASERTISDQGASLLRSCKLPPGAVMMSCIATIGRCGITTRPSFTNQQINSLICSPGIDPKFIYYSFTSLGQALEAAGGGGSVYINVSKSRFEAIEILVPPLPIQRRIADILGTLDDQIENLRRMNKTLESMARTLFKSWFVDFDPVRAKMEGRQPAGMDAETAALFPDGFEDSELGVVPRGWGVKALGDVFESKAERVGSRNLSEYSCSNTGVMPRSEKYTKALSASVETNRVIRKGDFVFGLSRSILNFGFMMDEIGCVSPAYKVFEIRSQMIYPELLYWTMLARHDYYYGLVNGSSREGQSVNSASFSQVYVVIPPKELQDQWLNQRQRIGDLQQVLSHQSRTLSTLRDTLLPKLMGGEGFEVCK